MAKSYIDYNPFRPNGTRKQHEVDPLSNDDYKKVISFLLKKKDKRNFMMFVIGSSFALRITDILNLKWHYVLNPDLSIKSSLWLQESKRKRVKEIPINNFVRASLNIYINSLKEKNYPISLQNFMFTSAKGGHTSPMLVPNACRMFKQIFKDANVDPSFNYCTHTMRKTAGKELYDKGYDIWEISKLLGHSSSQETLCYIGITAQRTKQMYQSLHSDIFDDFLSNTNN